MTEFQQKNTIFCQ